MWYGEKKKREKRGKEKKEGEKKGGNVVRGVHSRYPLAAF